MKKLWMLSATALILGASPALADHHEKSGPEGGKGHKGKMFEEADANGDGVISKDEFIAQKIKHFEKMDADGDGSLTKEEIRAAHGEFHEKMREHREKRRDDRKERREDQQSDQPAGDAE